MNIGKIIKKKRAELNITQEELAKKLNVSRSTISNWEIERNFPDIQILVQISDCLDISLDTLLKGDPNIMESFKKDKLKHKRKIRILYIIAIIFMLLFLTMGFFYKKNSDILYENQIKSVSVNNDVVSIELNLPVYRSFSSYFLDKTDNIGEIVINTSIDLSMKNEHIVSIPIDSDFYADVTEIKIIGNDNKNLKTINLNN